MAGQGGIVEEWASRPPATLQQKNKKGQDAESRYWVREAVRCGQQEWCRAPAATSAEAALESEICISEGPPGSSSGDETGT